MNGKIQEQLSSAAQAALRREIAKAMAIPASMLVAAASALVYLTAAGYSPF